MDFVFSYHTFPLDPPAFCFLLALLPVENATQNQTIGLSGLILNLSESASISGLLLVFNGD